MRKLTVFQVLKNVALGPKYLTTDLQRRRLLPRHPRQQLQRADHSSIIITTILNVTLATEQHTPLTPASQPNTPPITPTNIPHPLTDPHITPDIRPDAAKIILRNIHVVQTTITTPDLPRKQLLTLRHTDRDILK